MKAFNCVLAGVFTFLVGTNLWAIPAGFNVQGRLTDANGINKDGTFQIKFSVFANDIGGSPVWEKNMPTVIVKNGNFQIILQGQGDNSAQLESAVKDLEVAYVEIKVGTEPPLVPRQPLLRSPFSPPDNFVGAVMWFYRTSCPNGFIKADGTLITQAAYPNLASAMGKTGNFNLPDLRGEFIRGVDDGRGVDPGRMLGSAQTDAFQGHKHSMPGLYTQAWPGQGGFVGPGMFEGQIPNRTYTTNALPVDDGQSGTPRVAAETRPRNVALLPCVKY
ncbi:MAG: hypothetical protein A2X34_06485 [Elusimicrobia bacterium GWC2_51_8]|nr:MAG: hypothetical protein A2X33_07335 [Elusimicrobia bacterium GWA2_51_34]OGR61903.1 MAG: hypothetical protein A2X34_06485 [Elusimicrobia bacterium GWC2_51_8]OGR85520.1 MAG: hypothetical protein A2021_02395 [Elusimicrobia bacterium GWF2_52_66]HAF95287.1 hypothetical protein [Elusimicrobiota bacterium]HCE96941.1 hypothetical protein [Elusimicrobiota bacterium]